MYINSTVGSNVLGDLRLLLIFVKDARQTNTCAAEALVDRHVQAQHTSSCRQLYTGAAQALIDRHVQVPHYEQTGAGSC
jgi:hypothetical protein